MFSQNLPPSGTPQQANLQAYYPFDVTTPIVGGGMTLAQWSEFRKEASQTTTNGWSDVSIPNSGISVVAGVRGNSLYSDGSSNASASFQNGVSQNNPINDIIDSTNSFTISFWYKLEDEPNFPNANRSLIGRRDQCGDASEGGNNTFFDIRGVKPRSLSPGSILAEIEEHQNGNNGQWLSNTTATSIDRPSCNDWINCVVTRSLPDINSLSTTRLYVDGVLRSTNFSEVVDIGIGESGVFEIGGSACINPSGGTRRFFGSFDELMVYDLALTQAEVAMLYQAYSTNFNANVSGLTGICPGQSTTLTANVAGGSTSGYSYLWSPGGETTQSITVSPTSTTIYTVTVSSSNCQVSIPTTVTILPEPVLDPTFIVTDIQCKGYNDYTVTLSGTGPGVHNWQVYTGNDMTTPVGNEITSIGIYGSTQFNVTIDIPGIGGDNFVIKHGVYDQCVPWSEQKQLIQLPCYSPLDAGFNLTYSCNNNSPEIKVSGLSNPCNTKWVFDLYDGATRIDRIGWSSNHSGEYNNDEYIFNVELEPCKEYVVKHGVWSDCSQWTETTQSVVTSDCPALLSDFKFQNTVHGGVTNIFYTCNSGIFFNGKASEGENRYYIDIWKYNTISNQFDWLANKGIYGWTSGEAGIFDLVSEFGSQGVSFSPGTYKVKLAVANNCNGWLPIEKTFVIKESIGTPLVSFGTYDASLAGPIVTTFIWGDPIWVKSPLTGAPANNLVDYRFELERIDSYVPLNTMPHGNPYIATGQINNFNVQSIFPFLNHNRYRLTCFAYNECGEEVSFSQDFEVIKSPPFNKISSDSGNLDVENGVKNNSRISLFPNPVKNNLYVVTAKNEIDRVEIYSMSGLLISVHKSTSIDVSKLSPGIYIARVFESNGYFESNNFIKQ